MIKMDNHPFADIFPLMTEKEIESLAQDIKENGLKYKIVLYHNKILDGRNRYKACQVSGIEPEYEFYKGDNALQYVISLNLHRRHLNESQRALVASRIANMTQADAGKVYGRGVDSSRKFAEAISQADAAKMLNVSTRSIQTAKKILEEAPEKIADIESGKKTITAVIREKRREEISKNVVSRPNGKYRVIYADPPWKYGDQLTESYGSTRYHYPTMSIQ